MTDFNERHLQRTEDIQALGNAKREHVSGTFPAFTVNTT